MFVSSNGVRVFWERQGAGAPAVLCEGGPGLQGSLGAFPGLIADLGHEVASFHQRGVGKSGTATSFTVEDFVGDLEAIRVAWGIDRWVVFGHSWGAGLALAYALVHPQRTRAVVYVSGVGIEAKWHESYHQRRLARMSEAQRVEFEGLRAQRQTATGADLESVRQRLMHLQGRLEYASEAAYRRRTRLKTPISFEVNAAAGKAFDAWLQAGTLPERLAALEVPVLCLHGAEDPRDPAYSQQVAECLGNGRYREVQGASHYPWVDQPEAVVAELQHFLGAVYRDPQ